MMSGDHEERQHRAARNELVFRAVNEQIMDVTERFQAELSELDLVCECADPSCTATVRLEVEEFSEIDRAKNAFIVLRGHEDAQVEAVVNERSGYVVVRKRDVAAQVVEQAR
jgi:hypothetical protein